jgi:copper(I)-binding protein
MPRFLALLLLAAAPAFAQAPNIEIQNAWSRAALAGRTGVVFLTIADRGAPDRLIAIESPAAQTAELHESTMGGGIMKMRPLGVLPIAPGQTVTLAPGGYHIMLVHLNRDLAEGDKVPVTLTFETAGKIAVEATVVKAGGPAPK